MSHYNSGSVGWLYFFPFLCFMAGYFLIAHILGTQEIETPALIGKPLHDAARELSAHNLNLRIVAEKADGELQAGTVVSQTPAAGKKIKENQSVFIAISKALPHPLAPQCINKLAAELPKEIAGTTVKKYYLPSEFPKDYCFAQFPTADSEIFDHLILYISSGNQQPVIWPDMTNKPLEQIQVFLAAHNLTAHILYPDNTLTLASVTPVDEAASVSPEEHSQAPNYLVTAQHPHAGTLLLLDPEKLPNVQLKVQ